MTADDIDYTYDDVGNMVTATDASANTTTYSYDDQNHLTGVDFPAGDDLAMVYDADGMRVSRTEGDTTVTYVGGLFEVEDDGATTILRTHYTFGGDHIAVRVDDGSTDTLTYLFGDHLGSIAATYEAGTAGTTNRFLHYYYPYGQPRGTQTVFPSDHTYTGQIDDPGGLMYYRARYYQPAIGRFTQPDTIAPDPGNSQDYNRYMYVQGNPIMGSDPTGHCTYVYDDGTCVIFTNGMSWTLTTDGTTIVTTTDDDVAAELGERYGDEMSHYEDTTHRGVGVHRYWTNENVPQDLTVEEAAAYVAQRTIDLGERSSISLGSGYPVSAQQGTLDPDTWDVSVGGPDVLVDMTHVPGAKALTQGDVDGINPRGQSFNLVSMTKWDSASGEFRGTAFASVRRPPDSGSLLVAFFVGGVSIGYALGSCATILGCPGGLAIGGGGLAASLAVADWGGWEWDDLVRPE